VQKLVEPCSLFTVLQLFNHSLMHNILNSPSRIDSRVLLILDPAVDQIHFSTQHKINQDVELIILDAEQDGILQITDFLFARFLSKGGWQDLALHIVALAAPGCLYLGNTVLSLDTLDAYARQLSGWVCSSVSLYADHLATGDAGEEWLTRLHDLTGATVHAAQLKPHSYENRYENRQYENRQYENRQWELAVTVAGGQVISHAAMPFSLPAI
jgi:Domain of unknown function (DUF4347)